MEYLEFELPIKELEDQLQKCKVIGDESEVDVTETCKQIEKKLAATQKEIYKNILCLLVSKKDLIPKQDNTVTSVWLIQKDTEKHCD